MKLEKKVRRVRKVYKVQLDRRVRKVHKVHKVRRVRRSHQNRRLYRLILDSMISSGVSLYITTSLRPAVLKTEYLASYLILQI